MARWSVVVGYALLGAVTQVLWITYAPVTDAAASYYGVSDAAIGWLANVFPLLYVLLAVPAGMVLDRWFRGGLALGAVLAAAGARVRLAPGYGWALAGQLLVGVAQPLVLNAITGVASRNLPPEHRATGIAIGSAGTFAGLIVGFGLGAVFASPSGIRPLLAVQAGIAVAVGLAVLVVLRRPAPFAAERAAATGFGALRLALRDPGIRRLCALVFVPFGVFVSLSTFLQPLLEPAGVPEATAGLLLVANVVAGVVGCAVVPVFASRRRLEVTVMGLALAVTALACVALATVPGLAVGFVAVIALGLALLPALPIVLELTERRAGAAEGTATGLIWLSGNLGGLVLAAVVGVLVEAPPVAFLLLAALSVLTMPLLRSLRPAIQR
ncbi:MAG TPA: MFS transporter [Actinophytocola sp.]|uniref:MFS transporter n=1 Tax=Actinophytocola sp. TaxID=1872138 RepID=UPI002F93D74B